MANLSVYQNIIHNRTYAGKHNGRMEKYAESVDRYIDYIKNRFTGNDKIEKAIEVCRELMHEQSIVGSMRLFFSAGKAVDAENAMAFNCKYQAIDSIKSFADLLYSLLCTCGVGISVQSKFVNQLPTLPDSWYTKNEIDVVEDTRSGWAWSLNNFIEQLYEGNVVAFDTSNVREHGAPLLTSGGYASGPAPLLKVREFILDMFNEALALGQTKIKPIQVHDICCMIADCAVQGGVRRAALISLFDENDEEMIYCKTKENLALYPWRYNSNNSMVYFENKKQFKKAWKLTKVNGEPGYIFYKNIEEKMKGLGRVSKKGWGVNPCGEIIIPPNAFCVSGDTKIITKDGIEKIEDVIGKEVEIWNGVEWSKVKPYQTGDNDDLYRVSFSDGSYLDATKNHKFLVKNRFNVEFKEIDLIDLIDLIKDSKYSIHSPRSNIKMMEDEGISINDAYEYGFFIGDGSLLYTKNTCTPKSDIFTNSNKPINGLNGRIVDKVYQNQNGSEYKNIYFDTLNVDLCKRMKTEQGLPKDIFSWNRKSILKFIAGWADVDGCNASKGIRIYGNCENIKDLQLLLTKVGINSSFNIMAKRGSVANTPNNDTFIRKSGVYYVQIVKTINIPCKRLICNNRNESTGKGKNQIYKSIVKLNGKHKSYCLTENKLHQCVFNNVLTKQCNLVEKVCRPHYSLKDDMTHVRYVTILALLQATLTDYGFVSDEVTFNQENDPVIGVSLTGLCDCQAYTTGDFGARLRILKRVVDNTVEEFWKVVGLKSKPKANTCVKPSGTVSQLVGCSSGIHPRYSKYYMRRVLIGTESPLHDALAKNGISYEDIKGVNGRVFKFAMKSPENSLLVEDVTARQQLEYVNEVLNSWCDHNPSCTVYVREHEWEEVENILIGNHKFIGLSFLPESIATNTSGFLYLPYDKIDKATYEKYAVEQDIEWADILSEDTKEEDTKEVELCCGGGNCHIS